VSGRSGKLPWARLLGEALLIFASVYVAIVLEGVSAERAREDEAREALRQLRAELVLDRVDAQEVLDAQRLIAIDYSDLVDWLGSPSTMPTDSFGVVVRRLGFSNPTAYPRKGAWSALSSTGLLSAIGDPELVVRVADHYESLVARVEYNGNDYDELLNATMMESVPAVWDRVRARPTGDLTELRGRLDYLATAWNGYYQTLMATYAEELDGLIVDVDLYLASGS
jgi:type II secretory pathway pseudopilin PulG